ncbi:putative reductase [compost metagenome]
MRADVQAEVAALWEKANTENLTEISDIEGYRNEFFNLFGFNFDGIDYNADTNEVVAVPSIEN